jgi:hypothetical protein
MINKIGKIIARILAEMLKKETILLLLTEEKVRGEVVNRKIKDVHLNRHLRGNKVLVILVIEEYTEVETTVKSLQ